MINEYVYCPRLFYYEQVEGVFVHNEHTAAGKAQHKRVDKAGRSAPKPDEESERPIVVRSISLAIKNFRGASIHGVFRVTSLLAMFIVSQIPNIHLVRPQVFWPGVGPGSRVTVDNSHDS